jgi:hypothetical protein
VYHEHRRSVEAPMTDMFAQLRTRPFAQKAIGLFIYGLVTFVLIYLVGTSVLDNPLFFRILELLWLIHIVIICNQIQRGQRELILLAVIALSPGIVNNLVGAFTL